MYGLRSESSFDAAHFLSGYPGKCKNIHGHRWRVVAYLEQESLVGEGTMRDMVIDFGVFKRVLSDLADELDHALVVEGGSLAADTQACLERDEFKMVVVPFRTTAENFSRYFFEKLRDADLPVSCVEVYETPDNCARYTARAAADADAKAVIL